MTSYSCDKLIRDAQSLGTVLLVEQAEKMLVYMQLLHKWNATYNLTAANEQQIYIHILDCLAVIPHIKTDSLLDIGSGGGLPGVIIALGSRGVTRVSLLDSSIKKIRFLRHIIVQLRLENVQVIHSRVEQFRPKQLFTAVISRAFAELAQFCLCARPLLTNGGELYAMVAAKPKTDISGFQLCRTILLAVPHKDQRHFIHMQLL